MMRKQRRIAAFLWCEQADAAAVVEAPTKTDSGGGARRVGRREEEDNAKRHEGEKWKDPLALFIRAER